MGLEPPALRDHGTSIAICRGVRRLFRSLGLPTVTELGLADGRRADIVALSPDGEITIVEVKSSLQDFRSDRKWPAYVDYCDRLYFAVHPDGPVEAMPPDQGLILADGHGAMILRDPPVRKAHPSRRRTVLLGFARCAATRLHDVEDPGAATPG
ncbi:MAG TPA: MmcB family DNA repair protein [Beijerinckiaceae bacterium]|jgi:hypothetical protein